MNQVSNNLEKITSKISEFCPYMLDTILNKVTNDGGILITLSFENMKIDMPNITDSKGQQIGSGSITMKDRIKMSAELYEKEP